MKAEDVYIGQRVQFRDWDDMKAEFGECDLGIQCSPFFLKEMRYLCGIEFTIENTENSCITNPKFSNGSACWRITCDMIKPVFCTAPVSGNVEVDLL